MLNTKLIILIVSILIFLIPTSLIILNNNKKCKLSDWSDWSVCSKTCGGGVQFRTRTVIRQSTDGSACPSLREERSCNTSTCSNADCSVSDWSDWSNCSRNCGGGLQSRTRTVTRQPSGTGNTCPPLREEQSCNTLPCPESIDCKVTDWSDWSNCSKTCGGGQQSRTRTVTQQPSGEGTICPPLMEEQICNTQACLPLNCEVSDWGDWSNCTQTCGTEGFRVRVRSVIQNPNEIGTACPPLVEQEACNRVPCDTDCIVSDWNDWSECSSPCEGGTQTRNRTVIQPQTGSGAICPNLTETQECNTSLLCKTLNLSSTGIVSFRDDFSPESCAGVTETQYLDVGTFTDSGKVKKIVLTSTINSFGSTVGNYGVYVKKINGNRIILGEEMHFAASEVTVPATFTPSISLENGDILGIYLSIVCSGGYVKNPDIRVFYL